MADDYQYVKLPDGSYGKFPASASDEQIKGVLASQFPKEFAAAKAGVSAPPLKSQYVTPQEVPTVGQGVKAFISQMAKFNPVTAAQSMSSVQQVPVQGQPQSLSLGDYMKNASLGNIVKNTASDLSNTLAPGSNVAERTGSGLANVVAMLATRRAAGEPHAVVDPLQNRPQAPTPAEAITNAINPPSKQMAGMDSTVQAQLPNILKYAQENNLPIRNRQDFMNVAKQAGEAARADYKNNVLGPHADVARGTQEIPNYQGETSGNGNATLSQLESRLTKINKQLNPKYEKGAGQSMPTAVALAPEQAAALDAEASGIRSLLNRELSARTGLTPEQVSAARAKGASMAGLADKMQMALNAERRAANVQDNSPAELDVTATGLAKDYATKAYRALAGSPADRAIRNALLKHNGR